MAGSASGQYGIFFSDGKLQDPELFEGAAE